MANELVMASPVSALLQGRQAAQQNQLGQMQIQQAQQAQQRDTQFRQALPAYLTGGTNALAALYSADPERAMQAQNFVTQQNALAKSQQIEQAKVAHAQATGVLSSASPARYMRVLLPQIAAQWSQQNGKAPDEMTDDDARSLAGEVAAQAGATAGIKPEEYTLGEGQARFQGGRQIASVAPKNEGDFTLSEGQTRFKDGKPIASVAKATPAPTAEDLDRPFKRANILRDEYDIQSKDFRAATDAYQRVLSSSQDPSAAGDLALIFAYMRTLDPGSTVREGEFATAQNAAGIPDRIRAQYNKIMSGERLAPDQRTDFVQKAGQLWHGQKEIDGKRRDKYSKLATRAGIAPPDVIGDEINVDVPTHALGVGQSTTTNGFKVTRKK